MEDEKGKGRKEAGLGGRGLDDYAGVSLTPAHTAFFPTRPTPQTVNSHVCATQLQTTVVAMVIEHSAKCNIFMA